MHGSATGPRVLLKNLREAMAESLGPQERLDRIVQQIAGAMRAQVCSVYVRRADDVLELFGTFGLKAEAVHNSQLKVGEGLVGMIAANGRPLNLSDAQKHQSFAYLPETGEELYKSFLGVPMKRAGRSLGVLVVQSVDHRVFQDEETEALETAAMVLSDLVASGHMKGLARQGAELAQSRSISRHGVRLSSGIGIGQVVLHEPRVLVERIFGDDEDTELRRLAVAISNLRAFVDEMLESRVGNGMADQGEHVDVLESYRMFAHDRGWVRRIEAAIRGGLTAEAATEKVSQDNRSRLLRSSDPYLRERLHDFDDLARRLMRQLMGRDGTQAGMDEPFVVLAQNMAAAELLDYDNEKITALILEEATPTSHVVIVARALGIAVVGQLDGFAAAAENGDQVIVDGDEGSVHLRPAEDVVASYGERQAFRAKQEARIEALRDKPSITSDGVDIELLLNAGLTMDLPHLEKSGAAGVGLFRTELQFMISNSLPRLDEQTRFYKSVLDAAGDRPVTFRTLDIGGDKMLPYLRPVKEENPALGLRSLRLAIDRPGLLRMQLRALLKAAKGRSLRIMLPMVTNVSEVHQVRHTLNREIEVLSRFEHDLPHEILLGAMIEVPNLLWQLDALMQSVDFVSVGTNDLFQFMSASDRTNSALANRYNPLSRPFFKALRSIVRAAEQHQTPLHLCGELASEPISALALLGIGYRAISMPPVSVGRIKEMVRRVDLAALSHIMQRAVDEPIGDQTLNEILIDYSDQYGIPI